VDGSGAIFAWQSADFRFHLIPSQLAVAGQAGLNVIIEWRCERSCTMASPICKLPPVGLSYFTAPALCLHFPHLYTSQRVSTALQTQRSGIAVGWSRGWTGELCLHHVQQRGQPTSLKNLVPGSKFSFSALARIRPLSSIVCGFFDCSAFFLLLHVLMWYAMSVGVKDSAWSTSAQPALLPLMRESSNTSVFGAARSLVEVGFRV